MTLASAIYEGVVRHRRRAPVAHALEMPLFMMYLDLAEVDEVFRGRWLWSASRPAVARFDRAEYLGDASRPLAACVLDEVERVHGVRPTGPIRLLTHMRYCGYLFNPVSFYYCHESAEGPARYVVAEITNTPWKERHRYVLDAGPKGLSGAHEFAFEKCFYVSPFMAMKQSYRWRLTNPARTLVVHMENLEATAQGGEARLFDATLSMRRREISGPALARVLVRYPCLTAGVIARIYWNALLLKMKGVPTYAKSAGGGVHSLSEAPSRAWQDAGEKR